MKVSGRFLCLLVIMYEGLILVFIGIDKLICLRRVADTSDRCLRFGSVANIIKTTVLWYLCTVGKREMRLDRRTTLY